MIQEYYVVNSTSLSDLILKVNKYLKEGWSTYMGITCDPLHTDNLYQIIIRWVNR